MSTEENKEFVRRYYEDVVNGAKVDDLPKFISPDYVEVHNNKRYAVGIVTEKGSTYSAATRPIVGCTSLSSVKSLRATGW